MTCWVHAVDGRVYKAEMHSCENGMIYMADPQIFNAFTSDFEPLGYEEIAVPFAQVARILFKKQAGEVKK